MCPLRIYEINIQSLPAILSIFLIVLRYFRQNGNTATEWMNYNVADLISEHLRMVKLSDKLFYFLVHC